MGYIGSVIFVQLRKSKHIREIVSRLRPRFEENRVEIRFETINTGACRNKREPEVRRLVFTPAIIPTAVAARPVATAFATAATTTTTADVESPSPQFSSTPVYTSPTTATTTNTTISTTMLDANQTSVVDQMMADLNKPL